MTTTTTATATMSGEADLNISLEPHLADTLTEVLPLLPDTLSTELQQALEGASSTKERVPATTATYTRPLISYDILSRISQWARAAHGQKALTQHGLATSTYSMVSLLAGTRTSPEKKFPAGPRSASDDASKELSDRRAVTTLLNALLSILGSGAAVWWAADRLRWKDEWKVLLAFFAAILVAVAEAVLFMIWNSRHSKVAPRAFLPSRRRKLSSSEDRSKHGDEAVTEHSAAELRMEEQGAVGISTSSDLQEHRGINHIRERAKPQRS